MLEMNFLLVGVWEKENGVQTPKLIGQAEIEVEQIFAKASQIQK